MYSEVLVDHTSFHGLRKRLLKPEDLPTAARELYQIVENLVIADTVWLTNSVTPQSMNATAELIESFEEHGLANSRSNAAIRIAQISTSRLREACIRTAPRIAGIVDHLHETDLLRAGVAAGHSLQPFGAQVIDYSSLEGLQYGSQEALEFVERSLEARGWGPVSILPLLNADLWRWFRDLGPSAAHHRTLRSFSTICRWQLNEEFAAGLTEAASAVNYSPAFGRVSTIEHITQRRLEIRLKQLEAGLNKATSSFRDLRKYLDVLGPSIDVPIPFVGLWVVQTLPEKCTLGDLIARIAELRADSRIRELKRWLREADEGAQLQAIEEIAAELKAWRPGMSSSGPKLEGRIRIPIVPSVVELHYRKEISLSPVEAINKFRRWLLRRSATTILTGFVEDAAKQSVEASFGRVRMLLEPSTPVGSNTGGSVDKVLFVSADPSNASRLRIQEEYRKIEEELQRSAQRQEFSFVVCLATRPADLSRALLARPRASVVHFSGHGSQEGAICLQNESGQVQPVPAAAIADLLGSNKDALKCVVLNACHSTEQADAILAAVPYVVAMSDSITDSAAIAYSVGFYQSIFEHETVPAAHRRGCAMVHMESPEEKDLPVLRSR